MLIEHRKPWMAFAIGIDRRRFDARKLTGELKADPWCEISEDRNLGMHRAIIRGIDLDWISRHLDPPGDSGRVPSDIEIVRRHPHRTGQRSQ